MGQFGSANRYFTRLSLATLALLLLVLFVLQTRNLFAFEKPNFQLAAMGVVAAVLCFLWCEAAKRWLQRHQGLLLVRCGPHAIQLAKSLPENL